MDQTNESSGAAAEAILIPHGNLSPEALRGLVEGYVLREGTDYGEREFLLDQKVAHVMGQILRSEAQIMFDPVSQSVDIVQSKSRSDRLTVR